MRKICLIYFYFFLGCKLFYFPLLYLAMVMFQLTASVKTDVACKMSKEISSVTHSHGTNSDDRTQTSQ